MQVRTALCAALLLAAALVGCSDAPPSGPDTPIPLIDIRQAVIDSSTVGGVYVSVSVAEPAMVTLRYWAVGSTDTVTVVVPVGAGGAQLPFARLQPSRQYAFTVRATNIAGDEGPPATGMFRSPALPAALANVLFDVSGTPTAPLSMVELNGAFTGLVALDRTGTPVWWWHTHGGPQGFAQRLNGNLVIDDAGYGLYEVAPDGHVVHALDAAASPTLGPVTHHEVLATPTNTILFLAQEPRVVGDSTVTGDAIWEWTPETGALRKRFSVFDILDPALDVGSRSVSKDWVHSNSLMYGPHGNLILGMNWISEVVSIKPDFSGLEWRLGGRRSSFALDADARFQGQHYVSQLPNGHILMFDNERDNPGAGSSRALEIALDFSTMTAHRAWSYVPSPGIYAPFVGVARRLDNGNTVVHFGTSTRTPGATGPITTVEVTPAGQVVWRAVVSGMGGADASYRNEPIQTIGGERSVP